MFLILLPELLIVVPTTQTRLSVILFPLHPALCTHSNRAVKCLTVYSFRLIKEDLWASAGMEEVVGSKEGFPFDSSVYLV